MKRMIKEESKEIQLELFEYKPSLNDLQEQVRLLRESNERIRKGLYARQNAIEHHSKCLEAELEFLKAHICKG